MAVGAVYRELVSGPKTLIHRENTGKSPKFRLPGEGQRLRSGPCSTSSPASSLRSGTGKFLPTSRDCRQGAACRAESDDRANLQYPELLAFWVGRLLAHYGDSPPGGVLGKGVCLERGC